MDQVDDVSSDASTAIIVEEGQTFRFRKHVANKEWLAHCQTKQDTSFPEAKHLSLKMGTWELDMQHDQHECYNIHLFESIRRPTLAETALGSRVYGVGTVILRARMSKDSLEYIPLRIEDVRYILEPQTTNHRIGYQALPNIRHRTLPNNPSIGSGGILSLGHLGACALERINQGGRHCWALCLWDLPEPTPRRSLARTYSLSVYASNFFSSMAKITNTAAQADDGPPSSMEPENSPTVVPSAPKSKAMDPHLKSHVLPPHNSGVDSAPATRPWVRRPPVNLATVPDRESRLFGPHQSRFATTGQTAESRFASMIQNLTRPNQNLPFQDRKDTKADPNTLSSSARPRQDGPSKHRPTPKYTSRNRGKAKEQNTDLPTTSVYPRRMARALEKMYTTDEGLELYKESSKTSPTKRRRDEDDLSTDEIYADADRSCKSNRPRRTISNIEDEM